MSFRASDFLSRRRTLRRAGTETAQDNPEEQELMENDAQPSQEAESQNNMKEDDNMGENYNTNRTYNSTGYTDTRTDNAVSKDTLDKIEIMDNEVIQHFRIAFGNRIVAQMKTFVPVFVGCGGDEVEGVDYFLARKVVRKFEQLNISYIRDEIDPYIDFLNKTFGKDKMKECIEYLTRLKKLT